jgi:hypothetical protein
MDIEDAMECDEITVKQALRELDKHGVDAFVVGDRIEVHEVFTAQDGSKLVDVHIFPIDVRGHVNGGDVLRWLGY